MLQVRNLSDPVCQLDVNYCIRPNSVPSRPWVGRIRPVLLPLILVLGLYGLFVRSGLAQVTFSDQGFAVETVVSLPALSPVGIAWAPDGRMFIWQKEGIVRIFQNGTLLSTPFIDIQAKVNKRQDRGLLGLALDPNIAANGYVYLLYTYEHAGNPTSNGARTARLTRVTANPSNPNVAVANSEVILLGSIGTPPCDDYPAGSDCIPSDSLSHSVGMVRFAPDGKLFVSTGDGASFSSVDSKALRSQNLDSLAGKILRINPDGSAPGNNPFDDGANSVRSKVWAYGLRNPFRFGLKPTFGEPYIGDVGWNNWEEINRGMGANFGWPCYEGNGPQSGYQNQFQQCQDLSQSSVTLPLHTYDHSQGSAAALGGTFYTGTAYPSQYTDNFFIADYARNWIKRMVFDAADNLVSVNDFAGNLSAPVAVEQGPDGMLYYVSFTTGEVRRIRFNGPIANASAAPTSGYSPLQVSFSSGGSYDPQGGALTYLWDFGDGTPDSTAPNPTHTYASSQVVTRTATLTVTNPQGASSSDTVRITIGSLPPTATILAPSDGTHVSPGQMVTYQGSATDPDQGNLPCSSLSWAILLHHDTHVHPYSTSSGCQGSFVAADEGSVGTYAFEVVLTATDSSGLTDTKSILLPLDSQNSPPTVSITSPANGATFTVPVNIAISANASDSDGSVSKVDFYAGTTLIGTDTTNPYSITWNNVGAGSYTLTAKATDDQGAITTSIPVNITVNGGTGPTALFVVGSAVLGIGDSAVKTHLEGLGYTVTVKTSSAATSSDANGKSVVLISSTVSPTAVNTKFRNVTVPVITWKGGLFDDMGMTGSVSGIDFGTQASQTQLAITDPSHPMAAGLSGTITVASSSSTFVWGQPNTTAAKVAAIVTNTTKIAIFGYESGAAMPGLAAPARRVGLFMSDNTPSYFTTNGWALFDAAVNWATGSSGGTNNPPVVSITSPPNGATFPPGSDITISANASDSDGSVSKVDFHAGTTLIGTDTTSPYSITWNNVGAGSYVLTATATDNLGAVTASSPINITVNPPTALFVVGSAVLGIGDSAVKTHLEGLGYTVTVKTSSAATSSDANGKSVVLISSTVSPTAVNTKFRNVTVPVITWKGGLFDDMGMTGSVSGIDFGTQASQTQLAITDPSHPLAAGLSGTVTVASSSSDFVWGQPNTTAAKVAAVVTNTTKIVIFGYESGAAMPGLAAPARRVGLFMSENTASYFTANGWALFDAAANWATGQ